MMEEVKQKGNIIGRIHIPLVEYQSIGNKEDLPEDILKNVKDSDKGYAGFSTKEGLYQYLQKSVFDDIDDKSDVLKDFTLDEAKIVGSLKDTLKECFKVLPGGVLDIYIFPTFSRFVKGKMFGVSGYTPWRDTVLISVHVDVLSYGRPLMETLAHEFNHAVFLRDKKCESVLDGLIFEGLAEHFREQVVGGDRAPWNKVLDKDKAKVVFSQMQSEGILLSKDPEIYQGVFFGDEKYPRWTGYNVGYYLVENYLENASETDWQDIMKKKPHDIASCLDW